MDRAKVKIDVVTFLKQAETFPVIDVRSPSEFNHGHIPGAFNIPLFNDAERELVGIRYNKEGRAKAVLAGLELAGPLIHSKLEQALRISTGGKLLVHCWRGGMRSEAMAWLFSLADIETEILDGGYKAYRHYVLEKLSENRKMIVLGGLTGSGKTQTLNQIEKSGRQVIDLEDLASHKGSAFGSLGQQPQPTSEFFANLLYDRLRNLDINQPVWIEDESRNIGTVFLPEEFYLNIQRNPAIVILMELNIRLPRLLKEYSGYSQNDLIASVMKIRKRLGGDKTRDAIEAIRCGDFGKAIEITLQYYDKTYLFGLKQKQQKNIYYVKAENDNIEENARKILDLAEKLSF